VAALLWLQACLPPCKCSSHAQTLALRLPNRTTTSLSCTCALITPVVVAHRPGRCCKCCDGSCSTRLILTQLYIASVLTLMRSLRTIIAQSIRRRLVQCPTSRVSASAGHSLPDQCAPGHVCTEWNACSDHRSVQYRQCSRQIPDCVGHGGLQSRSRQRTGRYQQYQRLSGSPS